MAELEIERQKLEIDRQILALSQERLRVQEEIRSHSIELAGKAANQFQLEEGMREVLIQSTLPNILQLQNVTGIELALPEPESNDEEESIKDP